MSRRGVLQAGLAAAGTAAASGSLVGCSDDGGTGADKSPGLPNVPKVELPPEKSGALYPPNYVGPRLRELKPFADGSATYHVVVKQDPVIVGDWNKNAFSAWLEENTGVKIEYQAIDLTDLSKLNAMLASGDLPDAFVNMPFTNDQISLYGSQGAFIPLDDLIATYAPQMQDMMANFPERKAVITARDGKVYQFKGLNDCFHCHVMPSRAWVNQKYLDKAGATVPTTTEELRETLKVLKANDPTPDGNLIPLAFGTQPIDTWIMNAFTYNPGGGTNGGWMRLNNGKVEFVANTPEWRDALRYMRSLYDDGTLAATSFTMTAEDFKRAGNQGRLGIGRALYWGIFMDIDYTDDALWKDYVIVPPLKGPDGQQFTAWDNYLLSTAMPTVVVTSKAKNPELLIQWADMMMSLEGTTAAFSGIQDTNWGWAKEGNKGFTGEQAVWWQDQWPPPEGTGWSQHSPMYRSNDYLTGLTADDEHPTFEKPLFEATKLYEPLKPSLDVQMPPLLFDPTVAGQQAQTAVSVHSHLTQSMAKFATAGLDIDSDADWQAYVDQYTAMGLPAYLDAYQKAYDEQPKTT